MAEELEIKVKADTGEAVANLGKTEKAVGGVTKATEDLNKKQATGTEEYKKSTEGLNKMRGAAMETWAVLQLGVMAGNALSAMIDKMSASMAAHDAKMNDAAVDTVKFNHAMSLAKQGFIDIGGSQEAFLRRYDEYIAKHKPGIKATEDQTRALKEYRMELDALATAIAKAGAGKGFQVFSPEDAEAQLASLKSFATGLNDILGKALREGGETERNKWAQANKEGILDVLEAYRKYGLAVPEQIKYAMEARALDIFDVDAWSQAQIAAHDQVRAAVEQARAEQSAARNFSSPEATQGLRDIQAAAVGAAAAAGQFGDDLDHVAKVVVGTGGELSVGAQIWLQVAFATDEATDALKRHMVELGKLREEQAKTLDATKGWTDYVMALKEGYDSGVTSLGSYIQQLIAFKSQLTQMFAGATGDAKEALTAMQDLIEGLMQTAGGRDPGTGNRALDDLNRALAKAKEGKK